jgi:transposase InsO family protein
MSKARLVITAVTVEKRPVSEVARAYGVARSWVYALLARYQDEGEAAFEPRSRRPKTSPSAISSEAAGLIVRLRRELAGQGLDAGPVAWHPEQHHQLKVSAATVSRYLARAGLVTPDPSKRPKSSYIRFEADMPNECWQSDFTHYPLAGGAGTEILTWLDDHSRYALSVTAHSRVTGPAVLQAFREACAQHGIPASTLTDIQRHGLHHPPVRRQGRPQTASSMSCAAMSREQIVKHVLRAHIDMIRVADAPGLGVH